MPVFLLLPLLESALAAAVITIVVKATSDCYDGIRGSKK